MSFIKGLINLLYSAAVTAAFSYAFYNDTKLFNSGKYSVMGFPFDDSFGRRAKFLTYLNMVCWWLSFIIEIFLKIYLFYLNLGSPNLIFSTLHTKCTIKLINIT